MIKSDRWIRRMAQEHDMINPYSEKQVSEGVISYGVSSYGYDLRVADEFKIFTNVNSTIVDPKHFDERSFVTVNADVAIVPPNSFALARSVEYFKIPGCADHLRRQVNVCALRDHRERDPIRAGVGRVCHARNLEHHPAAGEDLCQ
jgi:deoxycytidine triphosphate deaminase